MVQRGDRVNRPSDLDTDEEFAIGDGEKHYQLHYLQGVQQEKKQWGR